MQTFDLMKRKTSVNYVDFSKNLEIVDYNCDWKLYEYDYGFYIPE